MTTTNYCNLEIWTLSRDAKKRKSQLLSIKQYFSGIRVFNRLDWSLHPHGAGWMPQFWIDAIREARALGLGVTVVCINSNDSIAQAFPVLYSDFVHKEACWRFDTNKPDQEMLDSARGNAQIAMICHAIFANATDILAWIEKQVGVLKNALAGISGVEMECMNPDTWLIRNWTPYLNYLLSVDDSAVFNDIHQRMRAAWAGPTIGPGAFLYSNINPNNPELKVGSWSLPPSGDTSYVCEHGAERGPYRVNRFARLHGRMDEAGTTRRAAHMATDPGYFQLWRNDLNHILWNRTLYFAFLKSEGNDPNPFVLAPEGDLSFASGIL